MKIHLNIGGNSPDTPRLCARAAALLARAFSGGRLLLSDYVESDPWGFESPRQFLNRGVVVVVPHAMEPEDVLDITQAIERQLSDVPHRNADGSYRDREIDIDIIDIDGISVSTPRLTLPHPRATARPFVTGPMLRLERRLADG